MTGVHERLKVCSVSDRIPRLLGVLGKSGSGFGASLAAVLQDVVAN